MLCKQAHFIGDTLGAAARAAHHSHQRRSRGGLLPEPGWSAHHPGGIQTRRRITPSRCQAGGAPSHLPRSGWLSWRHDGEETAADLTTRWLLRHAFEKVGKKRGAQMKQPAADCPAAGCIPKDVLLARRVVRWDGLSPDNEVGVAQREAGAQLSNLHLSCNTHPVANEPQNSNGTVIEETLAGCCSGCPQEESAGSQGARTANGGEAGAGNIKQITSGCSGIKISNCIDAF